MEMDLGKVVGSSIHNVTGTPAASLGLVGDWGLDTDSGAVWEKTAEGWQNRGSFKGQKGDKGDPGNDGVDGKTPNFTINSAGHLIATFEG